jgi:hypothetical protein
VDATDRARQLADQRKTIKARAERNAQLWTAACGPESLFRRDLDNVTVPLAALDVCVAASLVGPGQESVPRAPVVRVGKSLASHFVQVFLQSPPVLAWLRTHAGAPCAAEPGSCFACVLLRCRSGGDFLDKGSMPFESSLSIGFDVGSSLRAGLDAVREIEVRRGASSPWDGVQCPDQCLATPVDAVFSFVLERWSQCSECKRVEVVFERSTLLALPRPLDLAVRQTFTDLYLQSCAPLLKSCACSSSHCAGRVTSQSRQVRLAHLPQVLCVAVPAGCVDFFLEDSVS